MAKMTDSKKNEISNILHEIAAGYVDYEEGTEHIKKILMAR
jgi:hypothetical protein